MLARTRCKPVASTAFAVGASAAAWTISFLKRLGITSETSTSTEDGLNKLRANPEKYSLVLSDFNMPGMNGGDMCLELRKDKQLRHIPFICTSGNAITRHELNHYKMDDTLMKPFTVERLQDTIAPFLGWTPSTVAPPNAASAPVDGTTFRDATVAPAPTTSAQE